MGKIRRGGFVFVIQFSDHPPRHVHVYRDGKLLVKWDLDHDCAMKGSAGGRVQKIIRELRKEGLL